MIQRKVLKNQQQNKNDNDSKGVNLQDHFKPIFYLKWT